MTAGQRSDINVLVDHVGGAVTVFGWIDDVGEEGRALAVRDRTGSVALVCDTTVTRESAVAVTGRVARTAGAGGELRLMVEELAVLGFAEDPLPIDGDTPLEQRLDWRFLDLRRPANLLTSRVQTTVELAMREYWAAQDFLELHSPKLRPTPNRSGRELFTVGYFDRQAYLAQSPQFYKQMAMAAGLERVFEIGPVFRANPLVSDRHDTEFVSVDVEMSWIESHEEVMAFEERWLRHVLAIVEEVHGREISETFGVEVHVPDLPFPRIPLEEGRSIIEALDPTLAQPVGDIDAAGERALSGHVLGAHGHEFVFVTDYPQGSRPFYHMRTEEGGPLTRSFDLLWKGLEITTGAQREHRYDVLVEQARAKGVPVANIGHYLDFFRFGCPPHGGFGLGLTRLLMSLLGRTNVREVTFLHRDRHRLMP